MDDKHKFKQYLKHKNKKQDYIDKCGKLYDRLYKSLNGEQPTDDLICEFAKNSWSGYASRDKMVYDFLSAYADFCEDSDYNTSDVIRKHIKSAFEGLTKKAVVKYKHEMVFIPDDTLINPLFLEGLTNDEFVTAFRAWQEMIWAMYDEIERGSPFEWGFPGWETWTVVGVNQAQIMDVFRALAECAQLSSDALIVDKKAFGKAFGKACKPLHMAKSTLEKFVDMGLSIDSVDDKKAQDFTLSCPDTPNLITVMYSYFMYQEISCIEDCGKCMKKCWHHVKNFSYRYVEATERPPQETYYLAYTEGTQKEVRDIYDFLHDEAIKNGFMFQGDCEQGGLLYKKGNKKWLLAGSESSYHEVDFLFDPDYQMAVKVQFKRIFTTIPNMKEVLITRFPQVIYRKRSTCWGCRDECTKRIIFDISGNEKRCCNTFVFADPTHDDVMFLLELFKEENRIKLLTYKRHD